MRLVLPPRGANAGLKRYKGEGVYRSIGRKNTSLRKVTKEEADAITLRKKLLGKESMILRKLWTMMILLTLQAVTNL